MTYPNETDYWEVLNKKLIESLLTKPITTPYGINYKLADLLDSLTIKIDVKAASSDINILEFRLKNEYRENGYHQLKANHCETKAKI